jgi:hypothetical protein
MVVSNTVVDLRLHGIWVARAADSPPTLRWVIATLNSPRAA